MKCFTRTLFLSPVMILTSCNNIPHNDAHAIYPSTVTESPMVIDDSIIDRAQMDALSDIQQKKSKYYFYTNSIAPLDFVNKARKYGIEVVSTSCVAGLYEHYYNSTIDSLLKQHAGLSISQLLEQ